MQKYYAALNDDEEQGAPRYAICEHYGRGSTRAIAFCHSEEQSCFITDILNTTHEFRESLAQIPEVEE